MSIIDSENEYILYTHKNDLDQVLPKGRNFRVVTLTCADYVTWEQFLLPMQVRKDRIDILHCVANTAPVILPEKTRLILTLHDVMFLKGKETLPLSSSLYQRFGRVYRKLNVPNAVQNAQAVLTVSHYSKADILNHFPVLNRDKIYVTYLGIDDISTSKDASRGMGYIRDKFGIKGNYIMALGARDPRKNTELVIEAFLELKAKRVFEGSLVLVGGSMTTFENILSSHPYGRDVVFTGFVDDNDLAALYQSSVMFVYPSLYEGFGLPPLEAMFYGTPVIASNAGSIPEIVGDAALLIEPTREALMSGVAFLQHENVKDELIAKGASRVSEFSWNRTARKTLETYNKVGR